MKMTRRHAVGSLAVFCELAALVRLQAQTLPPAAEARVFQHDLPDISLEGWQVSVGHVEYAPGRVGQPHQHRGFLFAYVLEGAVIAHIIGDGVPNEPRTYRAGEMFYEPIGSTHHVADNASKTERARLLTISFAQKEA
jgi:quercetin dioxygenase-like cupin family protein